VKVDGGLMMKVAPMGGGKSLSEVRDGVRHMLAGDWWVTNIVLGVFDGDVFVEHDERWADRAAFSVCPASRRNRRKVRDRLLRSYTFTDELDHALRHAVPRKLRKAGHARLRISWDESLRDLNSREWDGGRGKTRDDRVELFERVPMLRKNGALASLLVQHEELLDKNARRICNWYVRVENQRETQRVMGMRLLMLPPLFIAYWYRPNKSDKRDRTIGPAKIERFFRTWHGSIYDSLGLYGVSRDDVVAGDVIWLGDELPALPEPPRDEGAGLPAPLRLIPPA
jgi:hypothetical protein